MKPRLTRRLLLLAVLAGCDGSRPDLPTAAPAGNRLASEQLRVAPDSLQFIMFTWRPDPVSSGAPAGAAGAGGAAAGQFFPGGGVGPAESGSVPGNGRGAVPEALSLVKPLVLTNDGATPMAWSAAESVDWLSVSPDSGTLAAGESRTLEVTLDSARLGIGEYRTHVVLTTGSTTRGVPVAVSAVQGWVLPNRREAESIMHIYGPVYFLVSVPAEADSLHVSVSIRTRDDYVDLYVRRGGLPGPGIADCAPPGMWRVESCDLPLSGAGDYFIMVEVDDWDAEGWEGSLWAYAPVPEAPYVPTLPRAPSKVTATGAGGAQRVEVRWQLNSFNANANRVHRSTRGPDGTFTPYRMVGRVGTYGYSFTDSTVALGATYRYRVEACDHHLCATSAASGPITVTQPPGPATHLAARAHPGPRIDLSWSYSGGRASTYQVWRSTRRPDGSYPPYTWFAGTRTSAYSDTAVVVGQRYAYHVRGCNAFGCTASSPVNAYVPPRPAAPAALRAWVYSATRVNLVWTDASTNESSFNVRRSLRRPDGTFAPYQSLAVLRPGVTSYIDRTVAAGDTYRYVVQACNSGGCASSASAGVTVPAS